MYFNYYDNYTKLVENIKDREKRNVHISNHTCTEGRDKMQCKKYQFQYKMTQF